MRLHPLIAVYNHPESGLSNAEVDAALLAFKYACDHHFEPAWNATASFQRFDLTQVFNSKGIWELHLLGVSDTAGALGYHLDQNGRPIMRVFVTTDKKYNLSWTVTATHEIFEALADPWCLLASQDPNANKFYGYETGDPVEGDQFGYKYNGVLLSDFVLPAWFTGDPGPYDYAKHASAPFQVLPDGYCSIYQNGNWTSFQMRGGELMPTDADSDEEQPRIRDRTIRRDHVKHIIANRDWS
jgi:hypothetical protein